MDPAIGAQIYRYAEYRGGRYTGETAAALLLANQMAGLRALTRAGIVCKVNTVMLKGINDAHIPRVVETVRDLGAELTNIMQLIPVKGSVFENLPLVSNKELMDLRKSCEPTLRQMYHCKQCRADAVGLLGDDRSIDYRPPAAAQPTQEAPATPVARGIRIAVASKTGATVDQHFGQTDQFYIYESDGAAAVTWKPAAYPATATAWTTADPAKPDAWTAFWPPWRTAKACWPCASARAPWKSCNKKASACLPCTKLWTRP